MLQVTLTLGPASQSEDVIRDLARVANRFRLNASHLDRVALDGWIRKLEGIFGSQMPRVVLDLQGAKIRIGKFPSVEKLPAEVRLVHALASDDPSCLPIPEARFFRAVQPGDRLSLNDARVTIEITSQTAEHGTCLARVLRNGPLSSFKGINRAVHPIPYNEVSEADRAMIEATRSLPYIEYAFSFTHDGKEAALLRPLVAGHRLAAKLERPESLEHLSAIDAAFDETWLCRGDLGAQAGVENLGRLQEKYVETFSRLRGGRFLAGQVLEHLTHFPDPTRSEVVHLYDCARAGFTGIVISDETAIGKNPRAIATWLERLIGRA